MWGTQGYPSWDSGGERDRASTARLHTLSHHHRTFWTSSALDASRLICNLQVVMAAGYTYSRNDDILYAGGTLYRSAVRV